MNKSNGVIGGKAICSSIKKNWLTGYVTIKVIGPYPERFFDLCARYQVPSWDIIKKKFDSSNRKNKIIRFVKAKKSQKKEHS